jgi:integrase
MPTGNITKRTVDGAQPSSREYFVWDSRLIGFGLRVQSTGAKSYVVKYRAGSGRGSPTKRVTLDRVGKITPDEARDLAKKTLAKVAHGDDPAAQKAAERHASTVAELAKVFLADHVELKRKAKTLADYRQYLEGVVIPKLGMCKVDKVTTADIARLHNRMQARPYAANKVLSILASMFAFAERRKIIRVGSNPVRGIERYPERSRERYLTTMELARLGEAIRDAETSGIVWEIDSKKPTAKHAPKEENRRVKIGPHAAAAIRLLIFTGARLREILHLKWEHVDFERGTFLVPDSKTGKKYLVLNAPSLAVLSKLSRVGSYVIAGDSAGQKDEKPRADLARPWRAVSKSAGMSDLRIHDLRHTYASIGAGAGLGLPVIGKLLGHNQSSTTQRYAHLDADPVRRASENIGGRIAAALEGQIRGAVVQLGKKPKSSL